MGGDTSSSTGGGSGGGGAYMSRGRTLAEVIFAVVCVGFLTGFVAFLCIGNCYRARRAAERQRQRRLANKLLTAPGGAVAVHAVSAAEGQGRGTDGGYHYNSQVASGLSGAAAAAMNNGGDMSPQSSTSSSNANGNNNNDDNVNGFGRSRFNQSQERTRLISNRRMDYDTPQQQRMHHDSNNAPRRRAPVDSSTTLQANMLLLSEQDEYDFPPHTANLMSV